MRLMLIALVCATAACATARPFHGLDVISDGYVPVPVTTEETERYAAEADRWANEARQNDTDLARQFLDAFGRIKTDPNGAQQELYRLVRINKARQFQNEIHRFFFSEAAALAVIRISFPTCREQFAVNVLRDRDDADTPASLFFSYERAGAWLQTRYHLGCTQ